VTLPAVVPVLTLPDPDVAVPLVAALAAGGLTAVEVTLRTPSALESVRRLRAELPEVRCGVGTLRTGEQVKASVDAGAQFLVSPGSTDELLHAMSASGLLSLPGAATPSEAMRLADQGFSLQKLFPAEASGGVATLSALAAPLPDIAFCATGGITLASAPSYLVLPNVRCVGGSWMAPAALVEARDWPAITALAEQTVESLGHLG
jgi:2-dehydro-3-deoxyphosphogluconate aldolase/(4S)-4-hydroxy-2-oxoglutarate aldolase